MTQIFAHRGSAGTHPENTMMSFHEALRSGAEGIELDVQLSKDGQVVIIHDESVDRTTNGKGYVKDLNFDEIKAFNASHKFTKQYGKTSIPTLEEFFLWFKYTALICNIELKNGVYPYPGLEEKVIGLIRKFNLQERIILSSFNHYSIVHCFQLAPEIEIAPIYSNGLFMPWIYARSIRGKAIHPSIKVISDSMIIESMKAGIAVRPYTVNSEAHMKRLIDIKCSAFFTDFPEKAVRSRKISRNKS
ncbi:glycerophosphoryl diester phosphodiesterase [Peribacillus deserti]|uniref:Glycerophosphoryl diester phosphodiesterase n=1 Tax=Peribacillus deserti TaxID=673318 RepID=A0ABS2QJR5_9BACI|nr:glycerophosphoryl diester phosphodiesterase [Peribacillus deserti]